MAISQCGFCAAHDSTQSLRNGGSSSAPLSQKDQAIRGVFAARLKEGDAATERHRRLHGIHHLQATIVHIMSTHEAECTTDRKSVV